MTMPPNKRFEKTEIAAMHNTEKYSLKCPVCSVSHSPSENTFTCEKCRAPTVVAMNLRKVTEIAVAHENSMWRYFNLLSLEDRKWVVSHGEGWTPLVESPRLASELSIESILLKNETIEFSAIKPLKVIDYIEPLSKKVFYTELPVQISIRTDTEALVNLLLELKNQSPVVSVKELHIKSSEFDTGQIEASMVLSTFMVSKDAT